MSLGISELRKKICVLNFSCLAKIVTYSNSFFPVFLDLNKLYSYTLFRKNNVAL